MNKLKEERLKYGFTQKELGKIFNIPLQTIEDMESEKVMAAPSVEELLLKDMENASKNYCVYRGEAYAHEVRNTPIFSGTREECIEREDEERIKNDYSESLDFYTEHKYVTERNRELGKAWKEYEKNIPEKDRKFIEKNGRKYDEDFLEFKETYYKKWYEQIRSQYKK